MKEFYTEVEEKTDLEQGDIFSSLPFLTLDSTLMNEVIPVSDSELSFREIDLKDYVETSDDSRNIVIKADIQPGIVITQNCDILRSDYVSFCAIRRYTDIEKTDTSTNQSRKIEFLTKTYANKTKYFYLPKSSAVGFSEKMAVDFSSIHQIKREVLTQLLQKRKCKLGEIPLEHFRSKISDYFKRFAYDGWYVLDKDEFQVYYDDQKKRNTPPEELSLINRYPWQR